MSGRNRTWVAISLVAATLLFLASPATADVAWNTTAADGNWNNTANWTPAAVPTSTDLVQFTTSNVTSTAHTGDKFVLGITFSGEDAFTTGGGGGVLYVYDGGITVLGGTNNQVFNTNIRPRGSSTFSMINNGSGLLDLNSDLTVHLPSAGTITGTFGGSGDVEINRLTRRSSSYEMNLVKIGAGTLTIRDAYPNPAGSGTGYTTGTTTINGGTISIDAEGNLGGNPAAFDAAHLTLDGGALQATASFAIDDSNRGVTLGATGGTFDVTGSNTLTIDNAIVGTGGLTKIGTGTLLLNVANSYAGTTAINEGTLQIGIDDALPTAQALTIGDGTSAGSLDMGTFDQTVASLSFLSTSSSVTNTVSISAGKTLTVNGTGSLKLGMTGTTGVNTNATFSGGGTLNVDNSGGIMEVGRPTSPNNATPDNVAVLDLSALGAFTANVNELRIAHGSRDRGTLILSDTSNSITADTIHISNSAGQNALPGILTLGEGTNVIQTDRINIARSKGIGTMAFASPSAGTGTVTIGGKSSSEVDLYIADGAGTWTSGTLSGILDLRGHDATVTADLVVVGSRSDTYASNPNAGGANGYIYFDTGTFTANTVQLANRSNTGIGKVTGTLNISGGDFTVSPGGTMRLGYRPGSTGSATGTVNLSGGTLTAPTIDDGLNGIANFNFTGGTLHVENFGFTLVQDGGTLAPGNSTGTTAIDGDYDMNSGILEIEINSMLDHDLVLVDGDAMLDGTLSVLLTGPEPAVGDYYDILQATGTIFDNLSPAEGLIGTHPWVRAVLTDSVSGNQILRLTAVPEPSTLVSLLGLLGMGWFAWRRRRRPTAKD